jgi:arabinofuranan 3-O-arabinosyltransferase
MEFLPHAGTPARPRPLRFFEEARLEAAGYALAIIYAVIFVQLYRAGSWILDIPGAPVYTDFTTIWVAGIEAVRGEAARLYDSAQFLDIQAQLLGTRPFFYPNWPYPPIMLLIAAPFGALPYLYAFLSWDTLTLAALLIVVYRIVPRPAAIPLVLASPFTAWNFLAGQNGFLTGSLLGAALLCLQRRPVLAGIFIGCLSYKPQFGILLPVALIAARQWRAIASATVTIVALAGLSAAAFGIGAWEMLPTGLLAQKNVVLLAEGAADAGANWGHIQTIYGVVRELHGGGVFATVLHCAGAFAVAVIVWRIWRSLASYDLKAATVSAAALIATPYAFSYDMAALAIPVAFVARDQLRDGLLRREQAILLALFGIILAAFGAFWINQDKFDFGRMPLGLIALVTVMFLIMRRAALPVFQKRQWTQSPG